MKALLWVVAIVALAVALALAARYNSGYLLLVLPPYRVEFSLNLLAVLLVAGFAAGYALVRSVSATLRLPRQVREYRLARGRARARATLLEALSEYFSGRYGRAEKAAAASLDMGELPGLSAVLAARAAHELRAYERRDAYLARAAAGASGDEVARVVTAAELLLDEHRYPEALDLLKRLPRQHTAALRLELKAQQQARNWEQVAHLAEALRKRNVFDSTQAQQVRRYALAENLKRKALDAHALAEAWEKVPTPDRRDRRVAAAAAQCFIALGGCDKAHRILEEALDADWDSDLVGLYAECESGDTVKRIERAEAWLKHHPGDAALLLTLGRLCADQELWGKAQSYLEASLAIEPTHSAHLAAARLQERLGNADAARGHYRESLDLALAQLKAVTGGRRRVPL
ncbi:MAG: heme biosynthesis protein HemY [Betaproteobacteria bacterium]|nr:heme biosynthesis protein HemY [Betaproteobacteria bacterium]